MTRVSVIIPAHNAAATIKRAIQSALNQSMEDLEVLVISNGSTDQTDQIVNQIRGIDSRVCLLNSEKGRSRARNRGLKEATGEFIQFLDADDELSPNKLEDGSEFLSRNKHKSAFITAAIYKNDQTGQINTRQISLRSTKSLLQANYLPISSPLVKRQVLKKGFREDLEFNEDWLFWAENLYDTAVEVSASVGTTVHITSSNTMVQFDRMQMYECYVRGILKEEFSAVGPQYWVRDIRYALNYLLSRPEINDSPLKLSKTMKWPLRFGRLLLAIPGIGSFITQKREAVKARSQYGG